jgi:4a-hydroxytetrahydrobiopterin dehydratase
MRPDILTDKERTEALEKLNGWIFRDKAINRDFSFKNFSEAFAFMTRCALEAEKLNHHPDWKNVYSKVSVSLSTHDAGGVTGLDIRLATFMNKIAGNGI